MGKYILGYATDETPITSNGENLTRYFTKEGADYNSVEWLEIKANNELEARQKFESLLLAFKKLI